MRIKVPERSSRTWHRQDVAEQHAALARKQLATSPADTYPFALFLEAIERLLEEPNLPIVPLLLDVGCGAGHYGRLLELHNPGKFSYVGCDTPAMVEQARQLCPGLAFYPLNILKDSIRPADVILASGLLEILPLRDARRVLRLLFFHPARWVLIHRQELGDKTTATRVDAYGHPSWRFVLSHRELNRLLEVSGRELVAVLRKTGERHSAVLVRRPLDLPASGSSS